MSNSITYSITYVFEDMSKKIRREYFDSFIRAFIEPQTKNRLEEAIAQMSPDVKDEFIRYLLLKLQIATL